MECTRVTQTLDDVALVAVDVLAQAKSFSTDRAVVVALSGDLGAGKTALTKAIALTLGVSETVTSPTFVVMRQYDTADATFTKLLHMDAYRIESLDELKPLHFDTLIQTAQTLFCVEWPERIMAMIPVPHLAVYASIDAAAGTHTYKITTHG